MSDDAAVTETEETEETEEAETEEATAEETVEEAPADPGVSVTINGAPVSAKPGELLIDAAERHGTYIPRFCYHPRMKPVGMCRMCLVEVDTGRGMSLQPSCMLPVSDGMVVETESPASKAAQDGVLEFLLINHPLDCPVCDKGGECPLQDQTMAYGPGESRFVEEKRHYEKPIPISETVYLDRERCILCDRCTRFAADVAGDALIHFQGRGSNTEVNTFPDHPFASYFSGNTVQICPVGALTAKPYRFKARPWDLEETNSTCTGCSVGCRITVQSSRDQVVRYQGVDIDPVNWGWLCDKGRFGFEALNSEDRLTDALTRNDNGDLVPVSWGNALGLAAAALRTARDSGRAENIAVIGGSRLTNEDAYAWTKFAKGILGTDNVDAQLGDGLDAEFLATLPRATIDEVCEPGGTVIWLGPDPREELPVLFLRMRHAVEEDKVKLIELSSAPTSLSTLASASVAYRPGEAAAVAQAIVTGDAAGAIDPTALESIRATIGDGPVRIVVGRPDQAESARSIEAAAFALSSLPGASFLPVLRRANVNGAIDMGLSPGRLPGRTSLEAGRANLDSTWTMTPGTPGKGTYEILLDAAFGKIDVLILLGADPAIDFGDKSLAIEALNGARTVIALDQFLTPSASLADVVLPVAGFAETTGTTTNIEGRVSALDQKVNAPGTARSDWMVAAELALRLGADLGLESVDQITDEIARVAPTHAGITAEAVKSANDGILTGTATGPIVAPAADEPTGDAGEFRILVRRTLYDYGTLVSQCPASAPLASTGSFVLSPADGERLGVTSGDTVTVTSAKGPLAGPVQIDDGITPGTILSWFNVAGTDGSYLIDVDGDYTAVSVEAGGDA